MIGDSVGEMVKNGKKRFIAVIGVGRWGMNLVRDFDALGALHTICTGNPTVLASCARRYPGVRLVPDYADVLLQPEIAAVAITTPASTHALLARQAIRAGKDVFVEKPLSLSEREGRELVELARARERILMVGHQLWYHPAVLRLKELIEAGALGRIFYISANRLNLGRFREEENVLWSFAPHDISLIIGLAGGMPDSVLARCGNFLRPRVADTGMILLTFDTGIQAHIFVSWLHPCKEHQLVVVGERGMAVFDDTRPWNEKLCLYAHDVVWDDTLPVAVRAEAEYIALTPEEPLRAECAHFLECIAKRQPPRTDGEEGVRVLRVLNCCRESLEQERQIMMPL